jgi:hypothetical protein
MAKFSETGFGEFTSLITKHFEKPQNLLTRTQMAQESSPNELMTSETSGGHI